MGAVPPLTLTGAASASNGAPDAARPMFMLAMDDLHKDKHLVVPNSPYPKKKFGCWSGCSGLVKKKVCG